MIMGRESDKVKGGLYWIKEMDLIRKKVPNAKLYLVTADYPLVFLGNVIKDIYILNKKNQIEKIKNI